MLDPYQGSCGLVPREEDDCECLAVDAGSVSVSTGGGRSFCLRAPPATGGQEYVLLGSLSGTSPGLRFSGEVVPLNRDAYMHLSLFAPHLALLTDSSSTLDADGRAIATFDLPPGAPLSLIGLTASFAYLVFESGASSGSSNYFQFQPLRAAWVSSSVALTFVPGVGAGASEGAHQRARRALRAPCPELSQTIATGRGRG